MPKQLLEDYQGELILDRSAIVTEAPLKEGATGGQLEGVMVIPGRLSVPDQVNQNGRRYPRAVWESQLKDGSTLMTLIKSNACFGLLEHPESGSVTLASPISHSITEVTMAADGEVRGKLRVLNTVEGRKLAALIEAGYNPPVSSRGFGSVVKDGTGVQVVQDDYVCEGWDCVKIPSCTSAVLEVPRGAHEAVLQPAPALAVVEAAVVPAPTPAPEAPLSSACQAATSGRMAAVCEHKPAPKTMSLKTISEKLSGYTADPGSLTAQTLAENLQGLTSMHAEINEAVRTDPSTSWEGTQLHEAIAKIQASYVEAVEAPRRKLAVSEARVTKLLAVLKSVVETAAAIRAKHGTLVTESTEFKALHSEILSRGQGWRKRCIAAESAVSTAEAKAKFLGESMDELRKIYNDDVRALGVRVVETAYASQLAADPVMAKALTEAKTPEAVAHVSLKLKGLKESAAKPAALPSVTESAAMPLGTVPSSPAMISISESVYRDNLDPTDIAAITSRMSTRR